MNAAESLGHFRRRLHGCFARCTEALFELTDAVLSGSPAFSPVHLSLEAVHRRGWCSLYAALRRGRVDEEAARDLLATNLPKEPDERSQVFAVDVSVWPRSDAEASPGRGYYYHPSRHSAGQPIVAGWAYQLVAGLSFERDSWVAPMDARRVRPEEDASDVAAGQVRALIRGRPTPAAPPLFVLDAGYDPGRLQQRLEACRVQSLVRLHSGRTFYAVPESPPKRSVGRPCRHGKKFSCKDPSTWSRPTAEHQARSAQYGAVRVRAWSGLHPKTRRAAERYGSESAAVVEGTVVLVEVGRLRAGRGDVSPRPCGCGGTAKVSRTSTSYGVRTAVDLTLSTSSGSSSRNWDGPPRGFGTRSRLTSGRGWCWPPTRNSGWRAGSLPIRGCPGSDHCRPHRWSMEELLGFQVPPAKLLRWRGRKPKWLLEIENAA